MNTMLTVNDQAATDRELIQHSLAGNRDAFGQLVDRYRDRLFTSLCHLSGSHADAEDIAQEAFVQAYLKLSTFGQRCGFYTWLHRIALNVLYTRSRRQRVRASVWQTQPENAEDQSDPRGTPVDELERREDATQIRQALNALSAEHRAVLVLRGVEGFDYDTIAETLQVNAGTVRSRLHRARLELRSQLERRQVCGP